MQSEDYRTKVAEICYEATEMIEKLYKKSINKGRLDFINNVCNALIISRSVQYCEVADKMTGEATEESKLRQIQRFMGEYDLDYDWVLCFLLLLLPKQGKLTLCMDRTEWEFGSQNHNVLVISVYTHGVGIPIWFECLDNEGGNSDSDDRAYVLLSCIKYIGKERIKCIIGDCEFIGEEWIKFLLKEGISFYIDVRTNQYFTHEGKSHQISQYMANYKKKSLDNIYIFGSWLSIGMKRQQPSKKGKRKSILAIVTNTKAAHALSNYRNRWSIEVLFESLKTRGFNLEDTHIDEPIRLRKLFALCAIAFVFCFLTGLMADKIKKIVIKNNGYKTNSFFRHGLNFIRKAVKINEKRSDYRITCNSINIIFSYIRQILHDNFFELKKIVM
jgi:Transposase DDE domain